MFTENEIKELIKSGKTADFYNSFFWRTLSHSVIKEHHNECYLCKRKGKISRAILTHHVKHLKSRPDLAYKKYYFDEKGNKQIQLMPLCHSCHEQIHERGAYQALKKSNKFTTPERW